MQSCAQRFTFSLESVTFQTPNPDLRYKNNLMGSRAEAFIEAECFRPCSVDRHINHNSLPVSLRRLELPHTHKPSTIHFTICGSHLSLQHVQLGFESMVQLVSLVGYRSTVLSWSTSLITKCLLLALWCSLVTSDLIILFWILKNCIFIGIVWTLVTFMGRVAFVVKNDRQWNEQLPGKKQVFRCRFYKSALMLKKKYIAIKGWNSETSRLQNRQLLQKS